MEALFIYDLDGTLIDSKNDIINSFNYAFRKNKISDIDSNFFLINGNKGSVYFIKKNLNFKNHKTSLIKKINNDFLKHYSRNCVLETKCKEGLIKFLKKSKKNFVNIITTNKKKDMATKICKKLKINKYFDNIFGFDSFKNKKPSKSHLDEILKKYKIEKSKIIIFGDSEVDQKLSSHYKLKFVLLKNGYTTKVENEIKHDLLINNYLNIDKKIYKLINN